MGCVIFSTVPVTLKINSVFNVHQELPIRQIFKYIVVTYTGNQIMRGCGSGNFVKWTSCWKW